MSNSEKPLVDELSLAAKLEAMLFVSSEPVAIAQLATALDVAPSVVERGLKELDASYLARGLRVQRNAGRVQLTTAADLAPLVERFLGLEAVSHLSRAALDRLASVGIQRAVFMLPPADRETVLPLLDRYAEFLS